MQTVPRCVGGEIHLDLIQPFLDEIKWFVHRDNLIFVMHCDKHVVVEFTNKWLSLENNKGH